MGERIKALMMSPTSNTHLGRYRAMPIAGPITLSNYQKFEWLKDQLNKDGFSLSLPGQ
jgi:arylsulfatase